MYFFFILSSLSPRINQLEVILLRFIFSVLDCENVLAIQRSECLFKWSFKLFVFSLRDIFKESLKQYIQGEQIRLIYRLIYSHFIYHRQETNIYMSCASPR